MTNPNTNGAAPEQDEWWNEVSLEDGTSCMKRLNNFLNNNQINQAETGDFLRSLLLFIVCGGDLKWFNDEITKAKDDVIKTTIQSRDCTANNILNKKLEIMHQYIKKLPSPRGNKLDSFCCDITGFISESNRAALSIKAPIKLQKK